jgi:hypothetical protein
MPATRRLGVRRAAIEVKQALLGADHIDVGWASEGAARSLIDRDMFREAQPFAEREVAIKERMRQHLRAE